MPVAHSLLQIREELDAVVPRLSHGQLWLKPRGAASVGFHVAHLAGSLDRLFTYARGESLNASQLDALAKEERHGEAGESAEMLLQAVHDAIDRALDQLRTTPVETLRDERRVGRAGLPSTVLGLLFHAAEHAQRHAGQIATTIKLVA